MTRIAIGASAVFLIAVLMTMTGRGGGNFYVPTLVAVGQPMQQAATTAQFILMSTATAGMLVFQKHRMVDWKLAMVIEAPTSVMALVGGYLAHFTSGTSLKFVLVGLLVVAGVCMLVEVAERPVSGAKRLGFWRRRFGENDYVVNLWLVIPVTAAVGLAAGAVGISGGSFKVPLMVLACGVPMRVAVGTSSAMVAVTASMGFVGHVAGGDFDFRWALPVACVGVLGGLLGGKFSLKTKPRSLKKLFAFTTLGAAVFMMFNALLTG